MTTLDTVTVTANKSTYTQAKPEDYAHEANELNYFVRSMLLNVRTCTPVQIVAYQTPTNPLGPVGYATVQPLIKQQAGDGSPVRHGVIYGVPVFRIQGGSSAVIIDPAIGDIGLLCCSDRDASSVKDSGKESLPSSFRTHDFSDGFYFGGFLNAVPTQYVQFTGTGINVVSPNAINFTAPTITLNGAVGITGTATANGHAIDNTHKHSGVTTGLGITGVVT